MKYIFSARKMIQYLGGATKIKNTHNRIAKKYGFEPLPLETINSWKKNNSLRNNRLIELISVADELELPFDLKIFCHAETHRKRG